MTNFRRRWVFLGGCPAGGGWPPAPATAKRLALWRDAGGNNLGGNDDGHK